MAAPESRSSSVRPTASHCETPVVRANASFTHARAPSEASTNTARSLCSAASAKWRAREVARTARESVADWTRVVMIATMANRRVWMAHVLASGPCVGCCGAHHPWASATPASANVPSASPVAANAILLPRNSPNRPIESSSGIGPPRSPPS